MQAGSVQMYFSRVGYWIMYLLIPAILSQWSENFYIVTSGLWMIWRFSDFGFDLKHYAFPNHGLEYHMTPSYVPPNPGTIPSALKCSMPVFLRIISDIGINLILALKFGTFSTILIVLTLLMGFYEIYRSLMIYQREVLAYRTKLIQEQGPFDVVRKFSWNNPTLVMKHYNFFEFINCPGVVECEILVRIDDIRYDCYRLSLMQGVVIKRIVCQEEKDFLDLGSYEIHCKIHIITVTCVDYRSIQLLFKDGLHYDNFRTKYGEFFSEMASSS